MYNLSKVIIPFIKLSILLMFLLLNSCGYSFNKRSFLPETIQSICIDILDRGYLEPGFERVLTHELINELLRIKMYNGSNCDAFLKGEITNIKTDAASHTNTGRTSEKRIHVNVNLKLIDKSGKRIMLFNDIVDSQTYDIDPDKEEDQFIKLRSLEKISKRIAKKIIRQINF